MEQSELLSEDGEILLWWLMPAPPTPTDNVSYWSNPQWQKVMTGPSAMFFMASPLGTLNEKENWIIQRAKSWAQGQRIIDIYCFRVLSKLLSKVPGFLAGLLLTLFEPGMLVHRNLYRTHMQTKKDILQTMFLVYKQAQIKTAENRVSKLGIT